MKLSAFGLVLIFASTIVLAQSNNWIFSGPRDYLVGLDPQSVVVGDFNGDGLPDIATANWKSNNVSILVQDSNTSFQAAVNYPVGNGPVSLQVGDVNDDGKLDLLVLNATDGTVGVLLGNGDGTFQAQTLTTVSPTPIALAVGDFNGDGKLDAAVAVPSAQVGSYAVALLLGNGDGTFKAAVNYPVASQPYAMGVGDFNNDGKLDLVTIGNSTSVLLGNGDGTFQAAVNTPNAGGSVLVIADFNLDGKLDIATGPSLTQGTGQLFLGNGDGSFSVQVLSQMQTPVAAGDLNRDGKPDLIASVDGTHLQIFLGNGDGTFAAGQTVVVAQVGQAAVLVDMNADQKLDLVLTQSSEVGPDVITVVDGNGDGTLAIPGIYGQIPAVNGSSPTAVSLTAADFNGDGKVDLAMEVSYQISGLSENFGTDEAVYFNDEQGFLSPVTSSVTTGSLTSAVGSEVAAADFNGDGNIDLALTTNAGGGGNDIGILLGNGNGTFQSEVNYGSGMYGPIGIGDFNNDGKLDIIGGTGGTSPQVAVLIGNGDGTFGFPVLSPASDYISGSALAVADFNRDGNLDAAVVGQGGSIQVYLGKGDGTFSLGASYSVAMTVTGVAGGDFNGDGIPDLVLAGSEALVLLGVGDGTFQTPISTTIEYGTSAFVVADIDLDGKADIVYQNLTVDDIGVQLGNGDGTFQPPMQFYLDNYSPVGMAVADFNGDGKPDIAVAGTSGISVLWNVSGLSGPSAFLSPATLQFAGVLMGSKSSAQTAILSSDGPGILTIAGITIAGPQSGDFQQTNTCGTSLAPGLACTINVTFTPQAGGSRTASLTVTGTGSNLPRSISLTGTGQSFSIAAASSSQTISAGQTASYKLTVSPSGGLNQTVKMSCSGAPASSTCTVSPGSFTLNGQDSQAVTVTVGTTQASAGLQPPSPLRPGKPQDLYLLFVASLALVVSVSLTRSRRGWVNALASIGLLCVAMTVASCGGNSNGGGGGTSPGTYNLTVSGNLTSGSSTLTQSVKLTLLVQ